LGQHKDRQLVFTEAQVFLGGFGDVFQVDLIEESGFVQE